jgi:hypothetical protein
MIFSKLAFNLQFEDNLLGWVPLINLLNACIKIWESPSTISFLSGILQYLYPLQHAFHICFIVCIFP